MKGSVVQDHDLPFFQDGQQTLFKPGFDQQAVAIALEGTRCQNLLLTPRGDHRDAASPVSQAFAQAACAFAAPAVSRTQGVFHSGFIDIDSCCRRDLLHPLQELFALFKAALLVEKTLFLRV